MFVRVMMLRTDDKGKTPRSECEREDQREACRHNKNHGTTTGFCYLPHVLVLLWSLASYDEASCLFGFM
jgi:hypothetical protein